MMSEEERSRFDDWNKELMRRMDAYADSKVKARLSGGLLIDAAIPFRLGWTPDRAARAMMHFDHRDYTLLADQMMQPRAEQGSSE